MKNLASSCFGQSFALAGLCLCQFLLVSCSTSNDYDDEAINRRTVYRGDDSSSLLPSPAQAADEARQYQKAEDERKSAQMRGSEGSVDVGADGSGGLSEITAAYAQISVPTGPEEQPFFAPVKGRKVQEGARRKPIFLGKLGIDALLSEAQTGAAAGALPLVTGGMSLAARAKPGTVKPREGMGTYIVRPGDTLSVISVHIYGTSGRWMELAHLNRLGNGSIIFPKELILYIPDKPMAP